MRGEARRTLRSTGVGSLLRHAVPDGGGARGRRGGGADPLAERRPPPPLEGGARFPLKDPFRLRLLEGVAGALAHAGAMGAPRAVFLVHEVVGAGEDLRGPAPEQPGGPGPLRPAPHSVVPVGNNGGGGGGGCSGGCWPGRLKVPPGGEAGREWAGIQLLLGKVRWDPPFRRPPLRGVHRSPGPGAVRRWPVAYPPPSVVPAPRPRRPGWSTGDPPGATQSASATRLQRAGHRGFHLPGLGLQPQGVPEERAA